MANERSEFRRAFARRAMHFGMGDVNLVLGRFYTIRRISSWLKRLSPKPLKFPAAPALVKASSNSATLADALSLDGLARDVNLAPEVCASIREFADTAVLKHEHVPGLFSLDDAVRNNGTGDWCLPLAYVADPLACPQVRDLAADPLLLEAAARYIGYAPEGFTVRIWHSFAGDFDLATRRNANQTVDFHFDVDRNRMTYFYASFYLTDVDELAGPHTMILGSHRDKSISWCAGSSRRTEEEIFLRYGRQRECVITGPAGTGFLEDASCFHRALPPLKKSRTMLQVRYF